MHAVNGGVFVLLYLLSSIGVNGQGEESLVDINELKVCVLSNDCGSNNKIDSLANHATELAKNITSGQQNVAASYDSNFQYTKADRVMSISDECGQGSQFLSDVITSLNSDLTTTSVYAGKLYTSCADIYDKEKDPKDGYYNIQRPDGSVIKVYCLMSTDYCSSTGGWMRIGYFDTTSSDSEIRKCPDPLVARSYTELTQPLCQRASDGTGCDSFYYSSHDIPYSMVCGRARGYQYGSPDSFTDSSSVDANYLDGLSLTYGSNPRNHIWSFVGGVNTDGLNHWDCPCNTFNPDNPPSFIGDDYYCESGQKVGDDWNPVRLQPNDTLWDGEKCISLEGGCCKSKSLPWFTKQLGKTISNDIEVRLCDDETIENERVPIELVEIYVQ